MRLVAGGLTLAWLIGGCGPQPEQLWSQAQDAVARGDQREAAIHLRNLLQEQPNDAKARATLGEVMLQLGDPVSAEKELRRAQALGSQWPRFGPALAEALLGQGKHQDALQVLSGEDAVDSVALMLFKGQAYAGLGQWKQAEVSYRQVMAAAPDESIGYAAIADVMLATGRKSEADKFIRKALDIDPNYSPALILQGRRMVEQQQPAAAEAVFRQASSAAKASAAVASALAHLAEVQLLQSRLPEAGESIARLEAAAPGSPIALFLRARWEAQSGRYPEAIRGLQRLLNTQPEFQPAQRLLGTVHFLSGNIEQAAMYLSRLVAADTGDPFIRRLLAEIRLRQAQPAEAMAVLLPAMQRGPVVLDQGLLVLAGQASLMLGDAESALSYFRQGAEDFPDDERFRFGEVTARLASGDLDKARSLLNELRGSARNQVAVEYLSVVVFLLNRQTDEATALAERLVGEHAGVSWSHLLLAAVHLAAGRLGESRSEFEQVLRVEPSNTEALINLARLDVNNRDPAGAEARLRQAQKTDPADYRPPLMLADLYLRAGRPADALPPAREATRLAPDLPTAFRLLGRAAMGAGRWNEARQSFAKVTELLPEDMWGWLNLGRAAAAGDDSQAAAAAAERGLTLAPRDPAALAAAADILLRAGEAGRAAGNYSKAYAFSPTAERAMGACQASLQANRDRPCELLNQWLAAHAGDNGARMFRAAASERRGDAQAAIADYEAVLVYSPNNANALNNLAWLYHRNGDPRALATAERALKAAPEAPAIMDTAGWVALLAGDRDRGLKLLTGAAARAPGNPDIRYHLAYAQAQNGQAATARQTLDELLAGNTEFASRQDAQSLRQSLAR